MKKLVSIALVLLMCLPFLTSCHKSRPREAFVIPDEFDTSKNYELSFWAKNDTNKTQTEIYEKAIRDFEKLYPNIKVNMKLYTDYGKIYNDVITNIATDTTPNVCISYPDHIATYLKGENVVAPLSKLFSNEKYGFGGTELLYDSPALSEVIPEFLAECAIDGEYYAVPFMRSTEACYINKTYVEKLGFTLPEVLTWDFIWEVSEAATAKNDDETFKVNGQKVMIPFIYKSTDNMMIQMLRQKGAGYSSENGEVLMFNDTTRELLKEIKQHAETKAFSTFKISSYPANFLNAGQCIFAIDSTAGATWMGTHAPLLDIPEENLVEFETAVMPIPQYDAEAPQMISQGPSVCIFNKKDTGEVLASWMFAQFLLTNDVQIAYSETEGYVPVTTKAQESKEYKEYLAAEGSDEEHYDIKIKASKLLLENTENTFTTPVFSGSASLRDAAGGLIENVTLSVRRKKTVDDAYLDKLFSDTVTQYKLDQISVESADGNGKQTGDELAPLEGKLPAGSIALIVCLVVAWILIGAYVLTDLIKKKRHQK